MIAGSLESKFRANELLTVLTNRIGFLNTEHVKTKEEYLSYIERIRAYEDCMRIIQKEFFELDYSNDFYLDELKKYRDEVMEKINPVEKYRGTKEYMEQLKFNSKFAEILEEVMLNMYDLGYKRGKMTI